MIESAPKVAKRNATKRRLADGFQFTNCALETDCTGSNSLKRSSSVISKISIWEAESKRKECKTRAKGSSPESSFTEFS